MYICQWYGRTFCLLDLNLGSFGGTHKWILFLVSWSLIKHEWHHFQISGYLKAILDIEPSLSTSKEQKSMCFRELTGIYWATEQIQILLARQSSL